MAEALERGGRLAAKAVVTDELLDKSREVSDQGERKKLYSDLVKILQEDSPWIFILHPIEPKAFSPKVQNYDAVPDSMMRFKDVWLK